MSFGDHLEELRSCLIRALVGVVLGTIVSLVFGKEILAIVCHPLYRVQYDNGLPPQLQVLAPTAAFTAFLKIGFLSGLIVAMPWVLYQIWRFVASGLYPHETRFVKLLIPTSLGLFVIGVLFFYFVVLPIVLHFFIKFNHSFAAPGFTPTAQESVPAPDEVTGLPKVPILERDPTKPEPGNLWFNTTTRRLTVETQNGRWSLPLKRGVTPTTIQSQFAIDFYVSFVLVLALAFGIAFETPVVVFFLAWTGIVPTAMMRRGRRYVLLATVVAAALLTPPDVVSQLFLAAPMYLLFEVGVRVARLTERKTKSSDPVGSTDPDGTDG